jgi:hypothetical protein
MLRITSGGSIERQETQLMEKTWMLVAAAATLTACVTTSDVVPTGRDTFMVASHGVMGHSSGPAQKARAFESANAYCKKSGKEVETLNQSETQSAWGVAPSAEIEFRCVAPSTVAK